MAGAVKKVDVEALTSREEVLRIRVNKATVALAYGYLEVQKVICGLATEAAKLEAAIEEAQKNPSDIETTKKALRQNDDEVKGNAIKQMDLNASITRRKPACILELFLVPLA